MKVKLTHISHKPGCEGTHGDVIDIPDELGQQWIDSRGAVLVEQPAAPKSETEPEPEPAPEPEPEPEAKEAAPPKRKRGRPPLLRD